MKHNKLTIAGIIICITGIALSIYMFNLWMIDNKEIRLRIERIETKQDSLKKAKVNLSEGLRTFGNSVAIESSELLHSLPTEKPKVKDTTEDYKSEYIKNFKGYE